MGFKKDAIVSVYKPLEERSLEKIELYAQKLSSIPDIKEVSLGGPPPASQSSNTTDMRRMVDGKEVYGVIQLLAGDTKFLNLFEIEFEWSQSKIWHEIDRFLTLHLF